MWAWTVGGGGDGSKEVLRFSTRWHLLKLHNLWTALAEHTESKVSPHTIFSFLLRAPKSCFIVFFYLHLKKMVRYFCQMIHKNCLSDLRDRNDLWASKQLVYATSRLHFWRMMAKISLKLANQNSADSGASAVHDQHISFWRLQLVTVGLVNYFYLSLLNPIHSNARRCYGSKCQVVTDPNMFFESTARKLLYRVAAHVCL